MLPKYITRISDGRRFVLTERDTYILDEAKGMFKFEYTYNELMLTHKGQFKHN